VSTEKRKPVLGNHVAVKRKLISPFMNSLGNRLAPYSWTHQIVPEAIWIALIIDRYGYERAREICLKLVKATAQAVDNSASPIFAKLSAFATLNDAEKASLVSNLDATIRKEINIALRPLLAIAPTHPLAFLEEDDQESALADERFSEVLHNCYDRNGRLAVLSMALAYYLGIEQGKIHVAQHLMDSLIERFKTIGDYPSTEASQRAAGAFRAAAPMLFLDLPEQGRGFQEDEPWVGTFWNSIAGLGPCVFEDTLRNEEPKSDYPMEEFVITFCNHVRADLRARLEKWPLNLNEEEAYEVVSALLCRQATLVIEMACAPAIWTPHSAPVMLRAVADVFITLAWMLKDSGPRSKQFVEDGLGAVKLQIAHHERALEQTTDPDEKDQMRAMIEVWRGWLKAQRLDQFVEVNLGSWSGLNTRKMADEAGFIDFYNYVYQPFSWASHSNWAHVSMFNTVPCENPAHRGHSVPAIMPAEPDPGWLHLAAKYLHKTLSHFDEVMGLNEMPHVAFDFVCERLVAATGQESTQ